MNRTIKLPTDNRDESLLRLLNFTNGLTFLELIKSLDDEQIKKLPELMNFLAQGRVLCDEVESAELVSHWIGFIASTQKTQRCKAQTDN